MPGIKHFSQAAAALALFVLTGFGNPTSALAKSARYSVTFVPTWNPATFPLDYPITHARGGLLTPIIGATHGPTYRIFSTGRQPTPGLERLSEMGKHDPLDSEIKKAIADGKAGSLIEFEMASDGPVHPSVSTEFEIDERNPMVSLVGMIAPSPDWFYGVSNVSLFDGKRWVPRLVIDAYAWDSGGDLGTTYMAEDQDANPKEKTKYADTAHFVQGGKKTPVGVFVFKLVPDEAASAQLIEK